MQLSFTLRTTHSPAYTATLTESGAVMFEGDEPYDCVNIAFEA